MFFFFFLSQIIVIEGGFLVVFLVMEKNKNIYLGFYFSVVIHLKITIKTYNFHLMLLLALSRCDMI